MVGNSTQVPEQPDEDLRPLGATVAPYMPGLTMANYTPLTHAQRFGDRAELEFSVAVPP